PGLGLQPFASPQDYIARRADLGADQVARSFLKEASMGALFLDTGYRSEELHDRKAMGELAAVPVYEIVRLEAVAEAVAVSGVDASTYPSAFRELLDDASREAVGLKTIVAYRGGFSIDPESPSETAEIGRASCRERRE